MYGCFGDSQRVTLLEMVLLHDYFGNFQHEVNIILTFRGAHAVRLKQHTDEMNIKINIPWGGQGVVEVTRQCSGQ